LLVSTGSIVACGGNAPTAEVAPITAPEAEPPPDPPPRENAELFATLERGSWGWVDDDGCETNPHVIRFSDDRRVMELTHRERFEPEEGPGPEVVTYDVEFVGDDYVRGRIRGEQRRTDDGKLVAWDLVLVAEAEYCWRRTDWGRGCTRPIQRCPSAGQDREDLP
jgi:hypothetical protein